MILEIRLNDGSCCGRLQLNILKLLAKNASFEHHNKSLQQATRCNTDDYFTIDSRCQLFDTFFGFLFMVMVMVVKELVETLLCIFASAKVKIVFKLQSINQCSLYNKLHYNSALQSGNGDKNLKTGMKIIKLCKHIDCSIDQSVEPYQKERVFVWLPSHVMISHVHSCRSKRSMRIALNASFWKRRNGTTCMQRVPPVAADLAKNGPFKRLLSNDGI
ncbi:hypothetical protein T11_2495 [Trichinella zimbabwensis]|uniref:Uncharacterized protein n=1 Tax=Trichinella zimbabwensis TaxID=268475 RepID=A0A0V1I5Q5_9BILA|nr:hypothetical protein T11_2495 [Trichinella zimbabwensis]